MRFNQLGDSGIKVSAVALGTWAMGGDFWGRIDESKCIDALNAGLDSGINLIDTAPIYGSGYSEEIVGKAVKGRRKDIILATKCGLPLNSSRSRDLTRKTVIQEINESLKRLQTDYIDIYQVHWPDPDTDIAETMGVLTDIKASGKIRAIGVSNQNIDQLKQYMSNGRLDSVQPQYSLLEREIEGDILPFCRENNLGVLTYGSLGAGMLTGKFKTPPVAADGDKRAMFYPFFTEPLFGKALELLKTLETIAESHSKPVSHVAINWVSQQPGVTAALVGCKNPRQAVENADAGEWALSDEELRVIRDALNRIYAE
ncbi:MAG: aldo/keto reductase [Clostridiales bacterium]|nr:aldo/keto reductase [Clostridiales bacterium]